jgi:hypothetical protein
VVLSAHESHKIVDDEIRHRVSQVRACGFVGAKVHTGKYPAQARFSLSSREAVEGAIDAGQDL